MLVLDSGAVSRLAKRDRQTAAYVISLRRHGLWPPVVPSLVLVEALTGTSRDAEVNRFLKACEIESGPSERRARRAAELRSRARRGSAVDAIVVATAEPGGRVLTSDTADPRALAAYAVEVVVESV